MVIRPDGQNPRLSRTERKAVTIMVRLTVGRKKNGQQLEQRVTTQSGEKCLKQISLLRRIHQCHLLNQLWAIISRTAHNGADRIKRYFLCRYGLGNDTSFRLGNLLDPFSSTINSKSERATVVNSCQVAICRCCQYGERFTRPQTSKEKWFPVL